MVICQYVIFIIGGSAQNLNAKKELAFAAPSGQIRFGTYRSGASNLATPIDDRVVCRKASQVSPWSDRLITLFGRPHDGVR